MLFIPFHCSYVGPSKHKKSDYEDTCQGKCEFCFGLINKLYHLGKPFMKQVLSKAYNLTVILCLISDQIG